VPQVIVTENAGKGMNRCYEFISKKSLIAAERAAEVIDKKLAILETMPEAGRPFDDTMYLRELIIPFGDSGYIALYRYERSYDAVYILAFRHLKEANYKPLSL